MSLSSLQLRAYLSVNGGALNGQEVVINLPTVPEDPRILEYQVQALRYQQSIEELTHENYRLRRRLRPWWKKLLRLKEG